MSIVSGSRRTVGTRFPPDFTEHDVFITKDKKQVFMQTYPLKEYCSNYICYVHNILVILDWKYLINNLDFHLQRNQKAALSCQYIQNSNINTMFVHTSVKEC